MAPRSSSTSGMPAAILLVLLLLVSVLAACILAPVVDFALGKLLSISLGMPQTIIQIALLMMLLLCIGFRSSLRTEVSGSLNLPFYTVTKHLFLGLAVAIVFAGLCTAIVGIFRIRGVDFDAPASVWKIVLAALYIAVTGEILYRGFIFQGLTVELTVFPAIVISSAFFALVQLITPPGEVFHPSSSVDFLEGFRTLPGLFSNITDLSESLPVFIGYFLLAALYCLALIRTDSLYVSIAAASLFSFTALSRIVVIKNKILVGRKAIFGSGGTVPGAFMGGMMAWIALLVAIIAFLAIQDLSAGKSRKNN